MVQKESETLFRAVGSRPPPQPPPSDTAGLLPALQSFPILSSLLPNLTVLSLLTAAPFPFDD